ncbi:MAG: hypothetical protein DI629_20375 [Mesorhizobium amorphae]|nr:MAG: hypothetical protein DI629_20375 [Mesorhizobium amorphae]
MPHESPESSPEYLAYLETKKVVMALGLPVFADPARPLPLRIGAFEDLAEITGPDVAHAFLRLWTKRREYRAALKVGRPRYGLGGDEDGTVGQTISPKTAGSLARKIRHARWTLRQPDLHPDAAEAANKRLAMLTEIRRKRFPDQYRQSQETLALAAADTNPGET